MKFLSFSNSGCKEICANMIRSLLNCSYAQKDISISCLDEETYVFLNNLFNEICLFKNFVINDEKLKKYQDWSFDSSSMFRQIVKHKWSIIKKHLKNEQFVWIDTDIVVLKNLDNVLNDVFNSRFDIITQTDAPTCKYCTGFMIFNPTQNAKKVVEMCASNKDADDQIIFNQYWKQYGINVGVLDLKHFPNGYFIYKEKNYNKNDWYIVHNNHMVGIENKIQKFKENKMWYI